MNERIAAATGGLRWMPILLLAACTTVPPTNVHQPMTARPQPRTDALSANLAATGSIYQAGTSRTLFEDRRARYIGDTITVTITENTAASTKSNTTVAVFSVIVTVIVSPM